MASGLTPTYLLPYPLQTDVVNVASDVEDLATAVETTLLTKASLASPTFTGIASAVTAASDTSTTQIATTEFVINQGYLKTATASSTYAPIASPAFTGNPTATTQTLGNSTTRIATTAFVANALANFTTLPPQSYPATNGQYLSSNGTGASWNNIAIKDVTSLKPIIDGLPSTYAPLNMQFINVSESSYTLIDTDYSKQIEMTSSSANTLYIPTDSVNLPVGTTILVARMGTGQTTIAATSPGTTTVVGTPGFKLRAQYSVATLVKRGLNNWIITGDLVA